MIVCAPGLVFKHIGAGIQLCSEAPKQSTMSIDEIFLRLEIQFLNPFMIYFVLLIFWFIFLTSFRNQRIHCTITGVADRSRNVLGSGFDPYFRWQCDFFK